MPYVWPEDRRGARLRYECKCRNLPMYAARRQARRAYLLAYTRERRAVDHEFHLQCNVRTRIRSALKAAGLPWGSTSVETVCEWTGCSMRDLAAHLEAQFATGMTWNNYGNEWHVDHRRPCAAFDLTRSAQRASCFHWTNLQPMWAQQNLVKGANVS